MKNFGRIPFASKSGAPNSKLEGGSGYSTRIFARENGQGSQLQSGTDSEEHIVSSYGPNHMVKNVECTVENTNNGGFPV